MAAMTAVLATGELFELILLQVDMRTLLISVQLVNTNWHEFIKHSVSLQRKLHFLAEPARTDRCWKHNPLLAELFPFWFRRKDDLSLWGRTDFTSLHIAGEPAALQQHASWRRMFISQPPPRVLGSWLDMQDWGSGISHGFSTDIQDFADGLRMGELYDMTIKFVPPSWYKFFMIWTSAYEIPPGAQDEWFSTHTEAGMLKLTAIVGDLYEKSDVILVKSKPFQRCVRVRESELEFLKTFVCSGTDLEEEIKT